MREALALMSARRINPAGMVTHIGGLNTVIETTLNLPHIPGGKKLIYTSITMDLTALADLREKGKTDSRYLRLAEITESHRGLWSIEAENFLLKNF
jgi:hypothetical protein